MRRSTRRIWRLAGWLAVAAALVVAPLAAQDPTGKRHALVIGINGTVSPFTGIPRLEFARKDALEMTSLLESSGWEVTALVREGEGTRNRIVLELSKLAAQAREQDTVLIYFAGHGVRDPGPSRQTYWVTYLVNPRDLPVEGIRLSHLLEYIAEIPAARKLVILDHCHSGDLEGVGAGLGEGARDGDGESRVVRRVFPLDEFTHEVESRIARGLVIFGAAREEAYEFAELGHGIFTYVLLEALRDPATDGNRNGKVSIAELSERVQNDLATLATEKNIRQVPIDIVRGSGLSTWEPFDAIVGAGEALRRFLTELDLRARLDPLVKSKCFMAIQAWEQARTLGVAASARDQRIVDELNGLRDLEDSVNADTKREILERTVEALP